MKEAHKQLTLLLKDGKRFTYDNFSSRTERGFPEQASADWISWTLRCKTIIQRLFGENSAQLTILKSGLTIQTRHNGPDKFQAAKDLILKSLESAIATVEDDVFNELVKPATPKSGYGNKVFIVHGHDSTAKNDLEIFIREIGLEPIVLHRLPDQGRTVIEKFEQFSDVGFAFILLTPDELAYLAKEDQLPDEKRSKEYRSRPNVIFEFGYFVGKLGRSRVCALYKGNVALPSDVHGMLYKKFEHNIEEIAYSITKELKASGYIIK